LFSDAKLLASPAGWRFWRLVSEKNTFVGIPKEINRGTLGFIWVLAPLWSCLILGLE